MPENKVKVSALAISYNEEDNIERYLNDMSFADEIIIVDSYSTDKTVSIAKANNITIVQRKFDDFSSQRNYALTLAKNDWVVFFDFDEVISNDLKKEIIQTINSGQNKVAYYIKRNFHFMGKRLKYSSWQRDKVVRLFHKEYCKYKGLVHERVEVNGSTGNLKHTLEHFSYKDFDAYVKKLRKYSKLQALTLYQKNIRPNGYHFFIRPLYRFVNQYFFRLGFLDGKEGFVVSYLHSFAVFNRYLYLWTMYRKID